MYRSLGFPGLCLGAGLALAGTSLAKPANPLHPTEPSEPPPGGGIESIAPVRMIAADTFWLADWNFDGPGETCDPSGWTAADESARPLDASNYWSLNTRYSGQGHIAGNAAVLSKHDLCWAHDGYGNNWDYSAILKYRGSGSTLSFDFLSDSEPSYDFVTVEADSLCLQGTTRKLFIVDGLHPSGRVTGLALPDFGLPDAEHCVYICFMSDGAYSDEDGGYVSVILAGLVLDHLGVAGGTLTYSEDFEDGIVDPNIALVNSAPVNPGNGLFARLVHHPADNDPNDENPTCAWVFYDEAFPCGVGLHCVQPSTYNSITSPWVNLEGSGATSPRSSRPARALCRCACMS